MAIFWSVLILALAYGANCEQETCLTYDFENNFDHFRNEGTFCEPFPSFSQGVYSALDLEAFDPASKTFIYPGPTISCVASFSFPLKGGVVETNVFINSTSSDDYLTALILMKNPNGHEAVLGSQTIHESVSNVQGWYAVRLNVHNTIGEFDGYVAFIGEAAKESTILVDSFRFVATNGNEEDCKIYGDDDNSIVPIEPTEKPVLVEQCITYNFENDFDIQFTIDNYLCDGFKSWHVEDYETINLDSPNSNSRYFIAPSGPLSCMASQNFLMSANGLIEANVFMESTSPLDHIIILAQIKRENNVDAVVGFQKYYPDNQNFVSGWNRLNFTVTGFEHVTGYLILLGSAADGATVLIDSMRYIPPQYSENDEDCSLY